MVEPNQITGKSVNALLFTSVFTTDLFDLTCLPSFIFDLNRMNLRTSH